MANCSSYWLMPLLFIFHDFEELVLVPPWLEKHNPNIHGRILFGGVDRSDVLAIGIWEEFCIYLLLSAVAYWSDYPLLIVASIIPYLVHLVMHLIFPIVKHGYVPGVVTAIIELPMTIIYLIAIICLTNSPMWQWITVIFITFIFFAVNLKFIHWGMTAVMKKLTFTQN